MDTASQKIALVIGGSGLIGKILIQKLLESDRYAKVRILVRSKFSLQHPKLEVIIFNFDAPDMNLIVADDVYCCLGTTMKKAGSKENFYKVDYLYPIQTAEAAFKNGTKRFSIVTSMGADATSVFYYNQVKGEIEEALKRIKFESLFIFRPSLLLGQRPETRLGEKIGEKLAKLFKPIIPSKYKAIEAEKVAKAMLSITTSSIKGIAIYESDVLQEF